MRTELSGSRPLPVWLARMQAVLQTCGWWEPLQADEAGAMALGALQLTQPEPQVWADYVDAALWAGTRMDLSAFSSWVNQVLEAHSFQPAYPDEEQVVILPMSQMLARPFAAVVLAGCDEVRLNPSPEPSGIWTPAQRAALGMPSRKELEARLRASLRASWRQALQAPAVEVLWRSSDDTGEHIAASPLVQWLRLQPGARRVIHEHPGRSCPRLCSRLSRTVTAFRCVNYQPVPTRICALAPTAFLRYGNSVSSRWTSWSPMWTSGTSGSGCMRCCRSFTALCRQSL
ncbi:MAG: hypothetical protein EBR58_10990 [Betaproteobacteria bacterium]|nr:hypothetical protein [Betaproteobacteria bacterium]